MVFGPVIEMLVPCGVSSCFDEERRNLVVLEFEVVVKLDRAAWETPADFGGDDKLLTGTGDACDVGGGFGFGCRLIDPCRNLGTVVVVGFVVDMGRPSSRSNTRRIQCRPGKRRSYWEKYSQ